MNNKYFIENKIQFIIVNKLFTTTFKEIILELNFYIFSIDFIF